MAATDYFQRIELTDGDTVLDRSGDNVREDFMDAIYNIAPTKTPFMSGIGRGKSKDVYTSWQQDDLDEPDSGNAHIDGDDVGVDQSSKARRVGNINQISRKQNLVTGRTDTVDKAGRGAEMAYQLAKNSRAIKRDMEAILTGNQAAVADTDGTTATKLGGLRACFRDAIADSGEVTTALVDATSGANGGVTPGTTYIPAAATDSSATRAMSETLLRQCIEACYMNGGDPDTIMVTPAMKTIISTYLYTSSARVAAMFSDVGQSKGEGGAVAKGSVDIYVSDFGALAIIPNRFQGYDSVTTHAPRHRDVFVLDMGMWATNFLRSFRTVNIAKTGDAEKKMLLVDYTLCYKQEMASGGVFDVDHTTPMVA